MKNVDDILLIIKAMSYEQLLTRAEEVKKEARDAINAEAAARKKAMDLTIELATIQTAMMTKTVI